MRTPEAMEHDRSRKPSLADQLNHTVVRITSGKTIDYMPQSSGTGFFYGMKIDNIVIALIITNKHVISDALWLRFDFARMNEQKRRVLEPSRPYTLPISDAILFPHPDPDVDIVGIALNPMKEHLLKDGYNIAERLLSAENFPPVYLIPQIQASQPVLMSGFPNSLRDEANNLPILRRGILSTNLSTNYKGKQNIVVDIAVYPGSSGSPIFAYFDQLRPSKEFSIALFESPIAYLIGILHSGPTTNARGRLVTAPAPTEYPRTETTIMMHLGYAAKAHLIEDLRPQIEQRIKDEGAASPS
ncbi:S1 family peptidase [Paroceanicella profunda]|nr:serine protease [Paroceanicella profunda]